MEPIFKIHNLKKSYADRVVVDIQDLDIFEGEILALVGPSGSGKSTLLRMLNFLEPPTDGCIEFQGNIIQVGQEISLETRRKIATVFQRSILLNRTVTENVEIALRLHGHKNQRALVKSVLNQVGLDRLSNRRAQTLSGGEAQRVALARTMVLQLKALLLDEPTANLDPYNVTLIEKIVKSLNQDRNLTLVVVTHNVFQAKRLAHRVAFMLEGRIIEVDQVDSFFNTPRDPRTRAFIGGEMIY